MEYAFRNDLVDRRVLNELRRKSDAKAWRQTLSHFGAIGVTGALLYWTWGTVWAIPIFAVHGMLLNYLYAAQHELMHNTAFKTRALNEIVSRLTGFIVLFPRDYDRIMHFTHHTYTNIPGKDPELVGYNKQHKPYSRSAMLWRLGSVSYWYRRIKIVLRLAVGNLSLEQYMTDDQKRTVIREARWHLFGYGAIAVVSFYFSNPLALMLWLAPLMVMKFSHEIQNIVEHNGLPMIPDVLANTRSIKTNRLWRWMAWNMQYHCDHHLFAMVPFYNLPALHQHLRGAIENNEITYWRALADIMRKPRTHAYVTQTQ